MATGNVSDSVTRDGKKSYFFKRKKKKTVAKKYICFLLVLDSRKTRKIRKIPRSKVLSQAHRSYGIYPYIRQWISLFF